MKLTEFKIWLAGFLDALTDKPTEQQLAMIKQKLLIVEADVIEKIVVQEMTTIQPILRNPLVNPYPFVPCFPPQIICNHDDAHIGGITIFSSSNVNGAAHSCL